MTWPRDYAFRPGLQAVEGQYRLRPLAFSDRLQIREWRNDQLHILRQDRELTIADQDAYFVRVIEPQMAQLDFPPQVLFGFTEASHLVGYGGLVHVSWQHRRAEVSFLTATDRQDAHQFEVDWSAYLSMLIPISRDALGLHKLSTEAYESRAELFPILERFGFVHEGTFQDEYLFDGTWSSSVTHGLILEP